MGLKTNLFNSRGWLVLADCQILALGCETYIWGALIIALTVSNIVSVNWLCLRSDYQNPQLMKQLDLDEGVKKLKTFLQYPIRKKNNLVRGG